MEGKTDPEMKRLVKESTRLVYDFVDSNSPLREATTDFVLIPTDNPPLAQHNLDSARRAEVRDWKKIIKITASREAPGKPYTIFATLQSDDQFKPV